MAFERVNAESVLEKKIMQSVKQVNFEIQIQIQYN